MRKLAVLAILIFLQPAAAAPVTPLADRRPADNTFLTGPEWFLVFSPDEYAVYLSHHAPSRFPFTGHIRQFWQGYAAVTRADTVPNPNYSYHLMIAVIGLSTTVEYGLKALYETAAGRFSEAVAGNDGGVPDTAEDRLAAQTAARYVAFIKLQPWYEFDFVGPLKAVWRDTGWWGAHPLRKWERKYMLTSEYAAKAAYGWALGKATRASYARPIESTYVISRRFAGSLPPGVTRAQGDADGDAFRLPRYQAFTAAAQALAQGGADFQEIAGNRGAIMLSVVAPVGFTPPKGGTLLYRQDVLTQPGACRFMLSYPVAVLAGALRTLHDAKVPVEHIYDY
jgi:hypothetical protein